MPAVNCLVRAAGRSVGSRRRSAGGRSGRAPSRRQPQGPGRLARRAAFGGPVSPPRGSSGENWSRLAVRGPGPDVPAGGPDGPRRTAGTDRGGVCDSAGTTRVSGMSAGSRGAGRRARRRRRGQVGLAAADRLIGPAARRGGRCRAGPTTRPRGGASVGSPCGVRRNVSGGAAPRRWRAARARVASRPAGPPASGGDDQFADSSCGVAAGPTTENL